MVVNVGYQRPNSIGSVSDHVRVVSSKTCVVLMPSISDMPIPPMPGWSCGTGAPVA